MRLHDLQELKDKRLLEPEQFDHLHSIFSREKISVFYELRIMLYLGVMLFTTGLGILIYKNIGDIGHILSIAVLFILTAACFVFVFKRGKAYSPSKVDHEIPYFDYVCLLGCLLFVSSLTYLQVQYSIFDESMGMTTLVTAVFFFYIAYRFDHLGVLSLAITAFASFWSITISPQQWYDSDFIFESNLHNTAIIFGAVLAIAGLILDRQHLKAHFTFTYINFASLVYLIGALSGMFVDWDVYGLYLIALYIGCAFCVYFSRLRKSFLFLLYAFIFGYIGTTTLLADIGIFNDEFAIFFYFLLSCGGLIFFIIRFKNYFKRA